MEAGFHGGWMSACGEERLPGSSNRRAVIQVIEIKKDMMLKRAYCRCRVNGRDGVELQDAWWLRRVGGWIPGCLCKMHDRLRAGIALCPEKAWM